MRPLRAVPVLLLALAAAVLPGCPAFNNAMKFVGIVRPPELRLAEPVPQDFELVVHVRDQLEPAADYLLTFRRSGRCDYRITTRAPKRRESEGQFEIVDTQVVSLWETLRAIRYDELADRYPDGDDTIGPDKNVGIQAFGVRGNDLAKEVQAHFIRVPELEKLRGAAMSLLPEKATRDTGPAPAASGKSKQMVGDAMTKVFYPADDARLKDVPAERRQPFGSWYDAVNFGYSPAPGFKPWEREQ